MKRFAALFCLGLLFTSSLPAAATVTPSDRVKETVDRVLAVLQNPALDSDQRQVEVSNIVRGRFDFDSMSQIILATSWRTASPEQRERFIHLFRELLERTYLSAMDRYDNQQVRMGRERQKGNLAVVQTFITSANNEVPVSYKLRLRNDEWFAYDVTVDGISLVGNYRTSFRNLVKQKGMDGLLSDLEEKVAALRSKKDQPQ
jgi:phospholipid transport system substrate-binding protein